MARRPAAPTTTLNIRGIDAGATERIKRAAAARGMTLGAYLAALADLHDAMRATIEAARALVGSYIEKGAAPEELVNNLARTVGRLNVVQEYARRAMLRPEPAR